ncbi:MAG: phosphoglycolate phosphatase [Rhizobiaceae bacterium]|nr:phosphoglycolate phosphatase [Rhizobiaceae bacterium]
MSTPLIIFDLDGTLLHTAPDLMDSLNHTIDSLGLEPVHYEDMTFLVGSGARVMISRALELRGASTAAHDQDKLFDIFLNHYSASMPGASAPFPGLADALDRIGTAGMSMAVCTNKNEAMAQRLLELTGLRPLFAAVTGGDTFAVRKPDAGHILGTIELAGADRSSAIMIGDSISDISAAKAAGIPSIGVPFGYTDTPIEELNPDHIIAHYDELTVELVEQMLASR